MTDETWPACAPRDEEGEEREPKVWTCIGGCGDRVAREGDICLTCAAKGAK